MKRVYVVGTADTKGEELAFLADCISKAGSNPVLVDVGTTEPSLVPDVNRQEVARYGTRHVQADLASGDRGRAVAAMAGAFGTFLASRDDVAGVIGIGGGGGTSIATAGMRGLPLGIPKIMVSTLASGDVSPYVDISDIIMMPSITDLAGLNRISRMVIANAASAISAMAEHYSPASDAGRSIGLTMFGVTTACVTQIVERMKASRECLVFHATGTGGRTMEKLVDSGLIGGVIDITTTEICDLLCGGVLPATEDRLGAVARTGIPYVGSVGALDMVNFWAPETVPDRYRGRLFYNHNSNVTLMRTTRDESKTIGEWIGRKLNTCEGSVRFLIPEKGVSALDIEGGAFWDPTADEALFSAIEATVIQTAMRKVVRLPLHINEPAFAEAAVAAFTEIQGH